MKKFLGLILILVVSLVSVNAYAEDSYSDAVGDRLEGGLTNTLFGWTKAFSVPHEYKQQNKNPWAGAGKGVVDAIHCTVAGAFNLLTFPIAAEMSNDQCVDLGSSPKSEDWEGSTVKTAEAAAVK